MKLKIAFTLLVFPKLSETFILNQITGLIDAGHEVHIYPLLNPNEPTIHEQVKKYGLLKKTYYVPLMPKNRIVSILKLLWLLIINIRTLSSVHITKILDSQVSHEKKLQNLYEIMPLLKSNNYDIIHAHFGPSGIRTAEARSIGLLQGKFITSFYGFDLSVVHYRTEKYYELLFETCSNYITVSSFLKNCAISCGIPENRISVIPVGVRIPAVGEISKVQRDTTKITILTVARLVEKKGIEYSLAAFKQISDKYQNVHYNIVGDGRLRLEIERLIECYGLADKVTLHGAKTHEELTKFYKESDIFVLSCITARNGDSEGQALVLQEAQFYQLPVISSKHEAIYDGVVDGKTGFLVPEKDVKELEKAMDILIQDHSLRTAMGTAGRAFVINNFDQYELNEKLIKCYMSTISKEKPELDVEKQE